jgi:3-dehydroquinate synthase
LGVKHTLTVELGSRSYPVVIGDGLLGGAWDLAANLKSPECLIVSNETVEPLWGDKLRACLPGCEHSTLSLPDGEACKTLDTVEAIIDSLVFNEARRDTTLISLGGGVVGDMAGFAAACYMRGIDFIQVPTTLLAQVDASVGGKTGVNHPEGKNLIGAFHQPRLVLIDTDTLQTLPDREFRAGLAEVIKHGLIADVAYTDWIDNNMAALLARDPEALAQAILRSCEIKAAIVAEDERESGVRALLNYGHTFAHAIESTAGYGSWLHGEAVAAGMVMAAELSRLDSAERARIAAIIEAAGLPVRPPAVGAEALAQAMSMDKKVEGGRQRLVLLDGIGHATVSSDYDAGALSAVLAWANG